MNFNYNNRYIREDFKRILFLNFGKGSKTQNLIQREQMRSNFDDTLKNKVARIRTISKMF